MKDVVVYSARVVGIFILGTAFRMTVVQATGFVKSTRLAPIL